jgi:uncharacterized DUF497 family protein
LRFSWDEHKNLTNQRKHRVSFEVAARVFVDANRIEQYDDQEDYGEDRWITIGIVGPALLAVVYPVRDEDGEVIRLISARRANAQEKRAYSQHET